MLISVYVDDFLLTVNKQDLLDWVKKALKKELNIQDLGEVKIILDWQITWGISITRMSIIMINQSAFIHDYVEGKRI